MAASVHDADHQKLNDVFKSLGERGKEAEMKKEYNDHVVTYVLQQLSGYLSQTTANRIIARPYGSAVEDLKSLVPDDYGDVDVMIFPTSDDCLVYEEQLEYSPENPLHAKIKGRDHPVFQSCLVEDTDYLATTALKNFHSAIYGSAAPGLFDRLKLCLEALRKEDLTFSPEGVYIWENEKSWETSPAFSVGAQQSFETVVEQMQGMNESQNWPNLDLAQLEWFPKALCDAGGTEYTREHADVLSDYWSEEQRALATKDGSSNVIESFPALFQELVCGDTMQKFKARVQEIESRSQNETDSGTSEAIVDGQHRVTPENRDADESGSCSVPPNDNEEPCVTQQNWENGQRLSEDIKSTANFDSMENSRPDATSDGVDDKSEDSTKTDESRTEIRNSTGKEKLTSEDETHSEDDKEKAEKKQAWRTNQWLKHLLGTRTEMKQRTEEKTEEKSKEYKRKDGVDLVPALRSHGWPKVAREWIKRDRKWPSSEIVDKVIQEGYHMVVKPPKNGDSKCYFRISFSHAEFLLSQEMNEVQRECYRCLKKFHRAHLSEPVDKPVDQPKGLVTFYLKNILLETIEETGAEMWTEGNRAECMMKLLGKLLEALTRKNLPHFFVSSYNLFGVDYMEDPKILKSLVKKIEHIIKSPLEISKELIRQYQEDAKPVQEHEGEATEKAGSGGQGGNQSKEETSSSPVRQMATTHVQATNAIPNYRYHELEDICVEACKELIDKALSGADCDLETLDPVERSLVEDLRELASIHGLKAEEFLTVIKTCWESTMCYQVWMSTEPDMRRRMLDAIQGHVKMIKWMLKQDDFAAGNEQAIADRMLDPEVDDPFDLSHVIPAGGVAQLFGRSLESLAQSLRQPTQQHETNMDDIPLD